MQLCLSLYKQCDVPGYSGCFSKILYVEQLQVYERALRCIPEPMYSVDQDAAMFVTV